MRVTQFPKSFRLQFPKDSATAGASLVSAYGIIAS